MLPNEQTSNSQIYEIVFVARKYIAEPTLVWRRGQRAESSARKSMRDHTQILAFFRSLSSTTRIDPINE